MTVTVTFTFPHTFATLPTGKFPLSYFDDNFNYIANNIASLVAPAFANLPTTLPNTPGILWNNNGVICIS